MTEAAEKLGIRPQRLYEKVRDGVVSSQRYGRTVMVDPEIARKELEAAGYFRRSAMYKRKKTARTAHNGNSEENAATR